MRRIRERLSVEHGNDVEKLADYAEQLARSTSAGEFAPPDIAKLAGSLPVLWLAGRIDDGAPDAALKPAAWPVPLSHVADFVQRLPEQQS